MDENAHHENNLHIMRNTSFPKIPTEFTGFYKKKKNAFELLSTYSEQEGLPVHGILHFGDTRYGN